MEVLIRNCIGPDPARSLTDRISVNGAENAHGGPEQRSRQDELVIRGKVDPAGEFLEVSSKRLIRRVVFVEPIAEQPTCGQEQFRLVGGVTPAPPEGSPPRRWRSAALELKRWVLGSPQQGMSGRSSHRGNTRTITAIFLM